MSLLSHVPIEAADTSNQSLAATVRQSAGRIQSILDSARGVVFRKTSQLILDGAVVAASWYLAYLVRFDGNVTAPYHHQAVVFAAGAAALYLTVFNLAGIYRLVWRWMTVSDAARIMAAAAAASIVVGLADLTRTGGYGQLRIPLGVIVLHPIFCTVGCLGLRVLRRRAHDAIAQTHRKHSLENRRRVVLAGAGRTGVLLAGEIIAGDQVDLVGFADDDPQMQGRRIHGRPILGPARDPEKTLDGAKIDEVILCMPSASLLKRLELARSWRRLGIEVSTVPSLRDLASGNVRLSRVRPVKMEQLLGREVAALTADSNTRAAYQDSCVLVTGGAGSIGSEIVRQLIRLNPRTIVVVDKDENAVFETCMALRQTAVPVQPVVANVRDYHRIHQVFESFRPKAVFHAAAYKHVPLMEQCPEEAILNNVAGTKNVLDACVALDVRTFVLISTDKAINPANQMGASKRLAELLVQLYSVGNPQMKISAVRFGNVLGSRASVVPIFQAQILDGKSITVTHPDVRRYFMTIPEATSLVIQAGSIARGGDLFVLDMGDPVRIVDLARQLVELSGLEPDRDIKIEFVGLRPGEKLHEELFFPAESQVRSTHYRKIFVVDSDPPPANFLEAVFEPLLAAARQGDVDQIESLLTRAGIGYVKAADRKPAVDQPVTRNETSAAPSKSMAALRALS